MTQTANRRRKVEMPKDIRKKFAAALCMLLVAAIMMVGSTYAWFTLSTAPEVTGITTNIGANGNLEIALLNDESFKNNTDNLGIQTAIGDSMETKPIIEANETWGNLVDLSPEAYGLNKMILNPAALNLDAAGNVLGANAAKIKDGLNSPLLAPSYGSDGRVISVQTKTQAGKYDGSVFKEGEDLGGVRAIGVSSGVTVRITAYRSAVAGITNYMSAAKLAAQSSLVTNGQQLASMVIGYVADSTYKLTEADIAALNGVKTDLDATVTAIANAIKQAALAYAFSSANTVELSDQKVGDIQTAVAAISNDDLTLTALQTATEVETLPASIGTAITNFTALRNNINNATATFNGLVADESTYASATGVEALLNKRYVTVGGVKNPGMDDIGSVAGSAMSSGKITVTMNPGSGIYADIAALVGDYTASGLNLTLSYNGISVDNMPAIMNTDVIGYVGQVPEGSPEGTAPDPSGPDTAYIVVAANNSAAGEYSSNGGAVSIDDPYGYIIDFGVRTNAAGSNLLLDTDGSQRVYANNQDNLSTQGGGTYFEFTATNPSLFSTKDVMALMSAMRVVFVTPIESGYQILGVAAPDISVTVDQAGTRTVIPDNDTVTVDGNTVKAFLYLHEAESVQIIENLEYRLDLGAKKLTDENEPDSTICALEQNKAKKISALVYLDGDLVDNTMVANAKTSMSGKLNIQFKSSAELLPMDVRSMREANDSVSPSNELTALRRVNNFIKTQTIYTDAVAAGAGGTEEQQELVAAVAAVDALENNAEAAAVTSAGTTLKNAAVAAGITLPQS